MQQGYIHQKWIIANMDECVHKYTVESYYSKTHYSEAHQTHPYLSNYTPAYVHTWISKNVHRKPKKRRRSLNIKVLIRSSK